SWGSRNFGAPIRRNYRAACASASASRARWCSSHASFCSMNRSARSISKRACSWARSCLRLWRETAATVMLITHALDEAALLSDRVAVMSARPGRLIDVVVTGWPRERDSALVADPAFGALTSRLWALLREESRKALGV